MSESYKHLLRAICLLVLSMYPIHSVPPIMLGQFFADQTLIDSQGVPFYIGIFYLGFVLSGLLFIFSRFKIILSERNLAINLIAYGVLYAVSLNTEQELALTARLLLGGVAMCLYAYCFMYIFTYNKGLAAYASLFAIGTLFLDSFAFVNGIAVEYLAGGLAALIYTTLPLFFGLFILLTRPAVAPLASAIPETAIPETAILALDFKSFRDSAKTTLPSILVNVAFFIFLFAVGQLKSANISALHIGISIFSLSIAFPLGAKTSATIFAKMGHSNSMLLYVATAISGALTMILAVTWQNPMLLIAGTMLMAFGNAGVLIINTFQATNDLPVQSALPQVSYMLVTAMLTIILTSAISLLGDISQSFGYCLMMIYLLVLVVHFKSQKPQPITTAEH